MKQVPAVAVAVVAAVQANAWSPALKWLSILSMSLWARSHATNCLPALRWVVALQTVDTINSCPIAQHVRTTYRCGYLLWLFTHTYTSWFSAHIPEAGRDRQESSEDGTHLLQAVMMQLQMRAAQDAILHRTVTVSQTSRPVAVLMQMSKTGTGLTWRSVSGSEMKLRLQCDPAMLSMLLARVSVAGVRMRVRV